MAGGSSSVHLLVVAITLFFCLLRTSPGFRAQYSGSHGQISSLSVSTGATEVLLANPGKTGGADVNATSAAAAMSMDAIHTALDAWAPENIDKLTLAQLAELFAAVCVLADGPLNPDEVFFFLQYLEVRSDKVAELVQASLMPRCVPHVVLLQMARYNTRDGRRVAGEALKRLREFGAPEAQELLGEWEAAEAAAARRFQDAINGTLIRDPEAMALAARFYDSPAVVRDSTTENTTLSQSWEEQEAAMHGVFGVLRRQPMTDLECAQACAYGTALALKASVPAFRTGTSNVVPDVCRAYALLGGRVCLLSSVQFSADVALPAGPGEGRLRNFPTSAALNFCVEVGGPLMLSECSEASSGNPQAFLKDPQASSGSPQATSGSPQGPQATSGSPQATSGTPQATSTSPQEAFKESPQDQLLRSCQNTLTVQYTSAGAEQVRGLRNQMVLKHVCRSECEALTRAMEENRHDLDDPNMIGLRCQPQSWCTQDVVQLVEAHELECCGAACGWDPASRTCAGIHLLSNVTQEEWFAECCSPIAVMLGSDRDHMCKSASQVIWRKAVRPKEEPQPGALEAFVHGEDLGPKFDGGKSGPPSSTTTTKGATGRKPSTSSTSRSTTPAMTRMTTLATQSSAKPPAMAPSSQPQGKRPTTQGKRPTPLGPAACRNVMVGASSSDKKVVPLPLVSMTCGNTPVNKQDPSWKQTFVVDVSSSTVLVRRTDAKGGWQQPLELLCCVPAALVQLESRSQRQEPDTFSASPCALKCADPTFMKSALLQCSASSSREWVAVKDGTPTCPEAGLLKSEKRPSPEECALFGASTPGATLASWQFLPGDRSEGRPQQGLCALYQRCGVQAKGMFASAKAQMSNDTEVLWRRLTPAAPAAPATSVLGGLLTRLASALSGSA